MSISKEKIEFLEKLIKIKLEEKERNKILDYMLGLEKKFAIIKDANLDGVEPLVSVLDSKNVFREDEVVKTVTTEEILKNAPDEIKRYFRVPKTLD